MYTFKKSGKVFAQNYLSYTFIICTAYGLIDEIHQIFVPNRSAEFLDWVADLSGAILGVLIVRFFIKIKKKSID
ncbi:MAG: VanZ family protein [Ignavibacteriales bacterium]|nr:VanZ family protein [Ignavibacteriales bacterium]